MCPKHYERWRHHGDPEVVAHRSRCTCALPHCDAPVASFGLCIRHSDSLRRHGDPLAAGPVKALQCKVCDLGLEDDPKRRVWPVSRDLGVSNDALKRHRDQGHDNDPEWHAKRAGWWIAELQALSGDPETSTDTRTEGRNSHAI